jgi:hypothetical protein
MWQWALPALLTTSPPEPAPCLGTKRRAASVMGAGEGASEEVVAEALMALQGLPPAAPAAAIGSRARKRPRVDHGPSAEGSGFAVPMVVDLAAAAGIAAAGIEAPATPMAVPAKAPSLDDLPASPLLPLTLLTPLGLSPSLVAALVGAGQLVAVPLVGLEPLPLGTVEQPATVPIPAVAALLPLTPLPAAVAPFNGASAPCSPTPSIVRRTAARKTPGPSTPAPMTPPRAAPTPMTTPPAATSPVGAEPACYAQQPSPQRRSVRAVRPTGRLTASRSLDFNSGAFSARLPTNGSSGSTRGSSRSGGAGSEADGKRSRSSSDESAATATADAWTPVMVSAEAAPRTPKRARRSPLGM